jgi:hypothetical protein
MVMLIRTRDAKSICDAKALSEDCDAKTRVENDDVKIMCETSV